MKSKLKWNVYYHSVNKNEITIFNIFDHWKFAEDTQKNLKKIKDKDKFAEELRRDLFYYFCTKCEYEVIITPWCGSRNTEDIKVDVYSQVMNNFDIFCDYVWNSKKRRKKNIGMPNKQAINLLLHIGNNIDKIADNDEDAEVYLQAIEKAVSALQN